MYAINDGVDVGFPSFVDFVLPGNMVKFLALKLSIKLRNFRAYANTNVSGNTGASSGHNHGSTGGETGHNHSHNHTWHVAFNSAGGATMQAIAGPVIQDNLSGPFDIPTTTNAAASSGHTHTTGAETGHTHSLSVGLTGAIIETTTPQNVGILVDGGSDLSPKLLAASPYNTDQVELDLTPFLNPTTGAWHTIQLTTTRQGRIMGMLRVSYVANPLRL